MLSGQEPRISSGEYASFYGISEAEVWRKVRRGELSGRIERGQLMIYDSEVSAASLSGGQAQLEHIQKLASDKETGSHSDDSLQRRSEPDTEPPAPPYSLEHEDGDSRPLPPLPEEESRLGAGGKLPGSQFMTVADHRAGSTEVALLLDHLSLAKEENREILRLSQESIRKVSDLSDSIVALKDSVIEAKEAQIAALKEEVELARREVTRLRQQNEDLEMLTKTMAEQSSMNLRQN